MKHRLAASAALLTLMLAPHAVAAANETPAAPKLARDFQGQPVYGQLILTAQAAWSPMDAPGAPLREVQVLTPPEQWFAADAPLLAAYLAQPDAPLHAYF